MATTPERTDFRFGLILCPNFFLKVRVGVVPLNLGGEGGRLLEGSSWPGGRLDNMGCIVGASR